MQLVTHAALRIEGSQPILNDVGTSKFLLQTHVYFTNKEVVTTWNVVEVPVYKGFTFRFIRHRSDTSSTLSKLTGKGNDIVMHWLQ